MKYISLFVALIFIVSCKDKEQQITANQIVNKSIEVSGGDKFGNSKIEFDFRKRHYKAFRQNGVFELERMFKDSTNNYRDVLSNRAFKRFVNDLQVAVADSMIPRYSSSVNSVHYFSVLPYGLNDGAVNKFYLGKSNVKGKAYYKIKVTFNEEGGGEDFEDVFIYWINTKTFTADYLAYTYEEAHGYGLRFREAYNERYVNGLRFVDYNNYSPTDSKAELDNLDVLFEAGKLKLFSVIETENITVN